MARFHVYRLKRSESLVIDVQADILSDLHTRTVVPLVPAGEIARLIARLNPQFDIDGMSYIMATQFIGVVATAEIGHETDDFTRHADTIVAATDFLFQGF